MFLEVQLSNPDRLTDSPRGWYIPYVSSWRPRTILTVVDGAIALKAHGIGPTSCPPGRARRYHIEVVVRDNQEQPLAGSRTSRSRSTRAAAAESLMPDAGDRRSVHSGLSVVLYKVA